VGSSPPLRTDSPQNFGDFFVKLGLVLSKSEAQKREMRWISFSVFAPRPHWVLAELRGLFL
jgi:hypothetical protein